jgi:hypothetical protein
VSEVDASTPAQVWNAAWSAGRRAEHSRIVMLLESEVRAANNPYAQPHYQAAIKRALDVVKVNHP